MAVKAGVWAIKYLFIFRDFNIADKIFIVLCSVASAIKRHFLKDERRMRSYQENYLANPYFVKIPEPGAFASSRFKTLAPFMHDQNAWNVRALFSIFEK